MNKPVLITGASGFVGAHLAVSLATLGLEVTAVGGTKPCPPEVERAVSRTVQADLTEPGAADQLAAAVRPGAVVHAAALANTSRCQSDPAEAERCNVDGTARLLDACLRETPESRPFFVFISTDMVFDGAEAPPEGFAETAAPAPASVYSRTKLRAEELVRRSALDAAVVRTALVYGRPIGGMAGFLSWLVSGLRDGKCALFGDEYRTPVWIGDLCRTVEALLARPPGERAKVLAEPGTERLVHTGGRDRVSRVELGEAVAKAFGLDPRAITPCSRLDHPSPVPRPGDISLSSSKLERCLGIQPLSLADGLNRSNGDSNQ